jgi:hypothetical protein
VRSERTGNSPRGRRGRRAPDGRPSPPGQTQAAAGRDGGQRRTRGADNAGGRGASKGGPSRGSASRPPRTGGQGGGFQRRTSSTSGWTTVRPWRPPRDDADEPILDDEDTQPNWDTIPADRTSRQKMGTSAARPTAGRNRSRPPAWPGGGSQGGRRPANETGRTNRSGASASPRTRRPASDQRQNQRPPRNAQSRPSTWMSPDSAPPDEE